MPLIFFYKNFPELPTFKNRKILRILSGCAIHDFLSIIYPMYD